MKTPIKYLLLSILVITLFSCGSDDNNPNGTYASFRCTINGVAWEASEFGEDNGLYQFVDLEEQGLQIAGIDNGIRLRISITQAGLSACIVPGSYDFPNRVDISYATESGGWIGGHFYDQDANEDPVMTLRITFCSGGGFIGGTFSGSYTGNSGPDAPENIVIADGVFENIQFPIIEQ